MTKLLGTGEGGFVHGQADSDEPRELTFVAEDAIWSEAEAPLDADAFAHDAADDWYRQPAEDEPRDLRVAGAEYLISSSILPDQPGPSFSCLYDA